jgi:hypothetical protein
MPVASVGTAKTVNGLDQKMLSEKHAKGIEDRGLSPEKAVDMGLYSARVACAMGKSLLTSTAIATVRTSTPYGEIPAGTYPKIQPSGAVYGTKGIGTIQVDAIFVANTDWINAHESDYDKLLRSFAAAKPQIAKLAQPCPRGRTHSPHQLDRQVVNELQLGVGINNHEPVGLGLARQSLPDAWCALHRLRSEGQAPPARVGGLPLQFRQADRRDGAARNVGVIGTRNMAALAKFHIEVARTVLGFGKRSSVRGTLPLAHLDNASIEHAMMRGTARRGTARLSEVQISQIQPEIPRLESRPHLHVHDGASRTAEESAIWLAASGAACDFSALGWLGRPHHQFQAAIRGHVLVRCRHGRHSRAAAPGVRWAIRSCALAALHGDVACTSGIRRARANNGWSRIENSGAQAYPRRNTHPICVGSLSTITLARATKEANLRTTAVTGQ